MTDLTKGNEFKLLLAFAFPLMLAEILQQLFYTLDSLVLGNFLGEQGPVAIAAVGSSLPVIMLALALSIGISIGSTILTAQLVGAGDMDKLRRAVSTTVIAFSLAAIALGVVAIILCEPLMALLDVPNEVWPEARAYMRLMFAGLVFIAGYNETSGIFRGMGDSRTPLKLVALATVINIVLDLLFVAVLGLGVTGVAVATLIAQGVAFAVALLILVRRGLLARNPFDWAFDRELLVRILRLGLPIGLEMLVVFSGMLVVVKQVNSFGPTVMAAATIAQSLDEFALMPVLSIAGAVSAFVGQNIGAGRVDRIKRGAISGLGMALFASALVGIVVVTAGRGLAGLFTPDAEVIGIASRYFLIVGSCYFIGGAAQVLTAVVQGAGQTVVPMLISIIALWVFRVPAAWVLAQKFGPDGIWISQSLAWGASFLMILFYYRWGGWQGRAAVSTVAA